MNSNQLASVINSDSQNQAQETGSLPLTNQSIKKPQFCFNKCKNNFERCLASPGYSLDELQDRNSKVINKKLLEDELQRHGHPTSKIMPKKKRQRNVEEGKQELIAHYRYSHGF